MRKKMFSVRQPRAKWRFALARASRCGVVHTCLFCFFLFFLLTGPRLGGSRDELLMKPLRRGCVFFEEASCQTRFFESKVRFVVLYFFYGRAATR